MSHHPQSKALGRVLPLAFFAFSAAVTLTSVAAAGTQHVVAIEPLGFQPLPLPADARWQAGQGPAGQALLESPLHPFHPRIETSASGAATMDVPGARIVMRPLAVGSVTRALARGEGRLELNPEAPLSALVRESWLGIDETWELRPESIKHDLVIHENAVSFLAGEDFVASWSFVAPLGTTLRIEEAGGAVLRDGDGAFVARIPQPLVGEGRDTHGHAGPARMALTGPEGGVYRIDVALPGDWLASAEREFPILLDPTVSLQPTDLLKTGFVDELSMRLDDEMLSGSLTQIGRGAQNRGFAEFPTGAIPDTATITDVDLRIWLANHDNPADVAVPLLQDIKHCAVPASAPNAAIWAAIPGPGLGRIYLTDSIPRTGPEFCANSFVERFYDLGPLADADVEAQLGANFFTIGLASNIVTDPTFDHIDHIGFTPAVNNFGCIDTALPGSRITLFVTYEVNLPPVCNAGGPYLSDCPALPIMLDGSASSDPDGDPITFAWTSDCSGSIANADQAIATLQLDPSCAEDCTVTLAVSDSLLVTSCSQAVSAKDLLPPVVSGNLLEGLCLWSPRHDFFCLSNPGAYITAVDACQPGVTFRFLGCGSSQPDEAPEPGSDVNGDGNFPGDCRVSADGRDICVRVERAGTDPAGRYYSLNVEVDDGCGNTVVVPGLVHVPHDRSGGSGGQDDPCLRGNKTKR